MTISFKSTCLTSISFLKALQNLYVFNLYKLGNMINLSIFSELSNLVELCIEAINSTNAVVTNITCDNNASNIAMLQLLGAKVSNAEDLKTFVNLKNVIDEEIYVILDTSHLIKLVRGCLGDAKILYSSEGKRIQWNLIESLHKLQKAEGLHLATKLTKDHIEYHKKVMKVYLATQVISDSVADALQFCDKILKSKEFSDSEATCEFFRIFNRAFDMLDSKAPFAKGTKAPLKATNKDIWSNAFEETKEYILNLHFINPVEEEPPKKRAKKDTRVTCGPRKRGFLGFLVNMKTLTDMFEKYVEQHKLLVYILGHKTSQDHLEHLFCTIRSSLGCNNNPTAAQFQSAYKKIMLGATHFGENSNILLQDDTKILLPSNIEPCSNMISEKFDLNDDDQNAIEIYLSGLENSSEYVDNVLNYISGFIQKKVMKKESCVFCKFYLLNMKIRRCGALLHLKDRGGLTAPSPDIEKVVKIADSIYRNLLQEDMIFKTVNLVEKVFNKASTIMNELYPEIFEGLDDHVDSGISSHKQLLLQKIVACFVTLRTNHYVKEQNSKDKKVRVLLSKLILFKNQ